MTKTQFRSIQQTGILLEELTRTDAIYPNMPEGYTKALVEGQDHYSMLLFAMEKYRSTVITDKFWNEELRVAGESYDSDSIRENEYTYSWGKDEHADLGLQISTGDEGKDDEDFLAGFYPYDNEEDIIEDVKDLIELGFIMKPESEYFKLD